MSSTTPQDHHQQSPQSQTPDFPHHQHPHQHHLDPTNPNTARAQQHNLAVAASAAAGYAADNHLAGLVEAATAAAGQDVTGWPQNDDQGHFDGYPGATTAAAVAGGMHLDDGTGGFVGVGGDPTAGQVHFGGMESGGGGGAGNANMIANVNAARQMRHANAVRGSATPSGTATSVVAANRKRKRAGTASASNVHVDPAMTGGGTAGQYSPAAAAANGSAGPDVEGNGGGGGADDVAALTAASNGNGLDIRELPPQQALSDARAAGVHSAAALFRQPSATSKKYTRPPMSKMFSSLGLTPENFLHLQAAAKAYMLDEARPERRDCVGQRGKGDTEMVKLRLWNCVREFLEGEGNGVRFFGEGNENGSGLVWPRDEQRIISLVMPLLRRMVTNERQRQYAIETRKGGGAGGGGGAGEEKKRRQSGMDMSVTGQQGQGFGVQHHQQQQQHGGGGGSEMELGLLDLLMDGYPTDWESIARSYDSYNTDFRLDNLGSISGLQQADWWGLVAAVDCHYQIDHAGNAAECNEDCEACAIQRIVSSDSVAQAGWRVGIGIGGGGTGGMQAEDLAARNYFATGITRDVSHIIRDNLLSQQHQHQHQPQSAQHQPHPLPPSSSTAGPTTTTFTASEHQIPLHQITIHINTTNPATNGTKRLIPRLDVSADQCSDLASLLQRVSQHHGKFRQQAQQEGMAVVEEDVKLPVRVWLEEGLVDVRTDEEWGDALGRVSRVDWMDGEVRVVVGGIGQGGGEAGVDGAGEG
ncbi:hypothetical protein AJ79_09823 [Helicocarpus griseus UAMH5409]|uniref:Uncharacterized protein n=1 Tax=Helicocarpus griseus UAMH5409 TaxID=1447875 RepID=A0A2B7WGV3_9EURO|nr:hypothetical protein AJ79_09823 [Helicocarpus griseus UAMH5409]